ncbi:MAG: hypothetical protein ACI9FU_001918, partial [Granulosicoccus sp.]
MKKSFWIVSIVLFFVGLFAGKQFFSSAPQVSAPPPAFFESTGGSLTGETDATNIIEVKDG